MIDELRYRRQFNAAKKKLEREIYSEYALNTRTREAGIMIKDRKSFSAYPQTILSETDTSNSNLSRKASSASHKSNLVQGDELIYKKVSNIRVHFAICYLLPYFFIYSI